MPDPQRCIGPPALTPPSLPAGIGFTAPGISVAFNPKFCCKLPSISAGVAPIAIPAILLAPLAKALKAIMTLINNFIALLALPCPGL
jgi:hypothetical protein